MRLDRALCERFGLSRAAAKRLIETGAVRLNGRAVAKGLSLAAGMRLSVVQSDASELSAVPDPDFRLELIYEDDALVVVSKPSGVPSHPLRPGELGTVANMLLARYPEMAEVGYGPREPGILHRLDNDTSGLLLAARTPAAFEKLRSDLTLSRVHKTYLALVSRALTVPRTLALPLMPSPKHPKRVEINPDPYAPASTTELVRCEKRGRFFLIEAHAAHAYRHQIRVHLATISAPIVGDALYGGEELPGLSHHLLHAFQMRFEHPISGKQVSLESPLPRDWPESP